MKSTWTAITILLLAACSSGPPPGFAPDPGLVSRMESIEMVSSSRAVCPGESIDIEYYAVMDNGTRIPFETRYNEDAPPMLHVVMLNRYSRDAIPHENGSWRANRDPLRTAMNGFELNALLKVNPSISGSEVLEPEYSCVRNSFTFSGPSGSRGQAGGNGLDVVVRLAILSSPFVERLLVTAIEVEQAPPIFALFDADRVSSADWLEIISRGGRGGKGVRGEPGVKGPAGRDGCPGGKGAPGGAGGVGGPGGSGGRGGRVTVIVSDAEPFLAGLVDVEVPGGRGGQPGEGGPGGEGGDGGEPAGQRRCTAGEEGDAGPVGPDGREGPGGRRGPGMEIIEVPPNSVFGQRPPSELVELLEYSSGR